MTNWRGEDALVSRPGLDVEVRRLPPGATIFLQSLAAGERSVWRPRRRRHARGFRPAANLAALFAGLIDQNDRKRRGL